MRCLITGASGFVGRTLCATLAQEGHDIVRAVRGATEIANARSVGVIDAGTDWSGVLEGMQAVVHLAARVHVMRDEATEPLAAFREVNTAGSLNLARHCSVAGVRRLVFVSSIKVHGEGCESPYSESDQPAPQDAYAISKWEAEQGLREIEAETGLEVVILRPPLVYGPGVGANFLRLMRAVERGLPLPFGSVNNRRSLLGLDNLVDAIRLCLEHPFAAGRTFLLSDCEDVSSAELIRRLAKEMNRSARLLPIPPSWLRFAGVLTGRSKEMDRLLGSLSVDTSIIRQELGWRPPFTLDEGLHQTVGYYLRHMVKKMT
jgi:nucleoside-diphosphate-sugar epimerase